MTLLTWQKVMMPSSVQWSACIANASVGQGKALHSASLCNTWSVAISSCINSSSAFRSLPVFGLEALPNVLGDNVLPLQALCIWLRLAVQSFLLNQKMNWQQKTFVIWFLGISPCVLHHRPGISYEIQINRSCLDLRWSCPILWWFRRPVSSTVHMCCYHMQHHTHNVFGLFVCKLHANTVHKEVAQAGKLSHTSGRYIIQIRPLHGEHIH